MGAALGLGSAAAVIVTACGSGGSSDENERTKTATGKAGESTVGGGPEVGKGQAIAEESEVTPEAAVPFTDAGTGRLGVLLRLEDGELAAYSAVCTLQACTVAYQPETRKLACPCHGSVFDPARGATVEDGPATSPLPEIEIEVRGDEVFLA